MGGTPAIVQFYSATQNSTRQNSRFGPRVRDYRICTKLHFIGGLTQDLAALVSVTR